ncbi:MAG: nucleoside kinase [Clostridiales bacterium]|nr:nucleoside kinase [Clostridiales bacterium]MCI6435408.1 nucleoside kinase [Clostridiales bacterium]
MQLMIDGTAVQAQAGESLREIIIQNHMDTDELQTRPLAAKIAGEVFTLNYIPVRASDSTPESASVRRAMAASKGEIHLLRYSDGSGKKVYTRTACFLVFLAIRKRWPGGTAKISCTMGNSVYISVKNCQGFSVETLKDQMQQDIREDFPLIRRRVPLQEAIRQYENNNQRDKAELLQWYDSETFDEYYYKDFSDYFFGEMLPSSGYLTVWNIIPAEGGFILLYPDDLEPNRPTVFKDSPNFFSVFSEGEHWGTLMECETAADLNRKTVSGSIRELIRVNEALHEKRFSQIADMVCQRNARVVMLAGPSSSGKTTSANRLATQLRVHGKKPILMSLDDYYIDRDKILPGPDGKLDLEHINTLDTDLFRSNIADLLAEKETALPTFNFVTGRREWNGRKLKLGNNSVIIVEGIHGLNPQMVPKDVAENEIFKLYVSPLLPLNLDNHNRIPTSYLRLLRRIVRDYETRGSSVQRTISMWESVQRGEKRWIFPFQENADVIFNSSTLYELAVLKKHIFPLLTQITPEDSCFDEVRSIVKILNYIREADVDDEIPPTSIVREFIGGNTFYR